MDEIDFKILSLLKENSRKPWKEIGELIHMTGQAVGNRIRRMEDEGIIEQYTIAVNELKLGKSIQAFITVFLKSNHHHEFQQYLKGNPDIKEVHRISGEGCYIIKASISDQLALNSTLDEILKYANYRVNISIGKIK
ncbi:Lrp/AsnC family transcriptional regulator [Neobacillus cucumis]|uniref:Lrp/AsnC family transcriptional regulator n=1 Tax=Neobacillus cucumis TaxID=1740721 RepID=UPI00203BFD02|nr:Lrp/AsnC family transcriptional regulator [Neobacillus cucumis]MCM3726825.1 Lrp/AsnC family transcriptional regulator [Neobacillus cucumis]